MNDELIKLTRGREGYEWGDAIHFAKFMDQALIHEMLEVLFISFKA